ncbi:hypothetical protein [Mesorhizobium sp. SP-1A]|uniref:hypothetical protein n=1 Tax=Mesorhizobium sp. SP-1A TaxID=3077840 RepID=UPI0028F6EEED|nr:hypothetical protein [Mesorhizobium sp. SP-1A]
MGRQNERLQGLTYTAGEAKYTVQIAAYGLTAGHAVVANHRTGAVHHENLSAILYHMDPYSRESDPMLVQLDDFDFAQNRLLDAQKELSQLVCDNKDFDFTKNISVFNDVIAETSALADKIKATIQCYKAEMAEALKDIPPSITVTSRPSGSGIAVEVTGLDINETLTMHLPKGFSRELVLELVTDQIKPSTLEAFKKAGRVIVDGKEMPIEDALTPKM